MEAATHIAALSVIAMILGGIGFGLAWLNARAVRLPLDRWPPPVMPLLPVALPTLAWAGMCAWLIALMAADPTAANLWPLTVILMAALWLIWIAFAWAGSALLRFARRR